MTYTILIVIALAIWAYIDFNAAKATGRWIVAGGRGIGNDIQAAKFAVQEKQVSNPKRQDELVHMLNDAVLDTASYQASARNRRIASHVSMTEALAKLNS